MIILAKLRRTKPQGSQYLTNEKWYLQELREYIGGGPISVSRYFRPILKEIIEYLYGTCLWLIYIKTYCSRGADKSIWYIFKITNYWYGGEVNGLNSTINFEILVDNR